MTCAWNDFGKKLIETEDLDPIYCMLTRASMPRDTLKRWLLAYWCYYHAGVASCIAEHESKDFHDAMAGAFLQAPRGTERRHFRGESAAKALNYLARFTPESVVDHMTFPGTCQEVMKRVMEYPQFGPWIAWKVADMAERVLKVSIDFSDANLLMYRDPTRGAALLLYGDQKHKISSDDMHNVVRGMLVEFCILKAPPHYDRPVNVQEMETVLCKFKSHVNGHYPMGKDTHEVSEALHGWGDLADELAKNLPIDEMGIMRAAQHSYAMAMSHEVGR